MSTVTLEIAGIDRVERELLEIAARLGGLGDLQVKWQFGGPAAPYALYVHEDIEAHHPRGGTHSYLVRPLLEALPHMAADIASQVQAGATLPQAMLQTAEVVMMAMKETTPVEFGVLRDSGHVVGPEVA